MLRDRGATDPEADARRTASETELDHDDDLVPRKDGVPEPGLAAPEKRRALTGGLMRRHDRQRVRFRLPSSASVRVGNNRLPTDTMNDDPEGFSEDALRGLHELDARVPPGIVTVPLSRGERPGPGGSTGPSRPHYWGHRARLRERFLTGGHKPMPDYELLELLLFDDIPRIDVKPLAKTLLSTFGDLSGVIGASRQRLLQVPGTNEKVWLKLRLVEAFAERMARARVLDRSVIASWEELVGYCRTTMAHREVEHFRILFLDAKNILVADEEQARGTVNHVPVYPREIAKRALELNASSMILVHNHPSGDPTPSQADIDMTRRIEVACEAIGVAVHDHIIVGRSEERSFREMALL
jgi:DNA repair protein RadC